MNATHAERIAKLEQASADDSSRLDRHEDTCAIRYKAIDGNMKGMFRMLFAILVALITVGAGVVANLMIASPQ